MRKAPLCEAFPSSGGGIRTDIPDPVLNQGSSLSPVVIRVLSTGVGGTTLEPRLHASTPSSRLISSSRATFWMSIKEPAPEAQHAGIAEEV